MELHKLKYFQVVAKYQHMTKASEEIHIAQPSLTQAIHSLEEELGFKLFKKKGRCIFLTEYGKYLKSRLDVILPEIDNLKNELEQIKGQKRKTIRLAIQAASAFVISSIVEYRKNHPDVIFDFEQSERKDNCDILVATDGVSSEYAKGFVEKFQIDEELFLVVPDNNQYKNISEINLEEVKDEKFVMISNARLYGSICNKFCALAGFAPKILFESDSPGAVQDIISTGSGVAFWPAFSWGRIAGDHIKMLKIKSPECKRKLIFQLYSRAPESESAEDFFNFLVNKVNKSINL